MFDSWKTWERGVPELAVEIVSPNDRPVPWESTLERYHELGVAELVRFDPEAPRGSRLRAWDRVDEDIVARVVEGERTPCLTLGLHLVVAPVEGYDALRLARDPEGRDLLLTDLEERAAERRIAELEAELKKRGG
jgi:Uma2 family endonuclease